MSTPSDSKPYLSLRFKLLIPLLGLGLALFVVGYFGAQNYLKNIIYNIVDEEAESIENYVRACLNVDVLESYTRGRPAYPEETGQPPEMQDPLYLELQDCVASVYQFNPRAWVYTYYQIDENTLAFGVDMWNKIDPPYGSQLGYPFTEADGEFEEHLIGLKELYSHDELVYDETFDVYYYVTTSPLRNTNGEVVGGLAIYIDAGWTVERLQTLSNDLLFIFAGIFALITIFVLSITHRAMRELGTFKEASVRVSNANYTPIVLNPRKFEDELSILADMFNTMVDKVEQREEDLQTQVEELKLQIDNEKREKDVKEIVDSQFFKDLKQRAAEARQQRQKKG